MNRSHGIASVGSPLVLAWLTCFGCFACDRSEAPRREPAEDAAGPPSQDAQDAAPGDGLDAAVPGDAAPSKGHYECLVPDVPVRGSAACARGKRYPDCRHELPDPDVAGGLYEIWRNTIPGHRWGRESLVSVILATAREHDRLHPGETITVGDLDAPGPRHKTHRHGVDVDLYLPGLMATDNRGSRDYPSNYEGRPAEEVRQKRARVLELARIVSTCAGGKVRIYYNDPPVIASYLEWFESAGLDTPFRRPMEPHNLLHLFHFHVTIAKAVRPLPRVSAARHAIAQPGDAQ